MAQAPRQATSVKPPNLVLPAQPVLHAAVGWTSSMGCRLGSPGLCGRVCTVSGCCTLAPGRLLQWTLDLQHIWWGSNAEEKAAHHLPHSDSKLEAVQQMSGQEA